MTGIPAFTQSLITTDRCQMLDVTASLARLVRANHIQDGMAIVCVPHTTAAVTINENADPDVQHDLLAKLSALVPQSEPYYRHCEGNSDAHLKASLVGNSVTLLIEGGRLLLGQWQALYFCEFDGPRQRQMIVKLVPW